MFIELAHVIELMVNLLGSSPGAALHFLWGRGHAYESHKTQVMIAYMNKELKVEMTQFLKQMFFLNLTFAFVNTIG